MVSSGIHLGRGDHPPPLFVRSCLIPPTEAGFEREAFLLTQQFPQETEITSCLQVPNRKALTQQGAIDPLPRDPCPVPHPTKQQRYPIPGERTTSLREEEVILTGISPVFRSQTVFM